MTHSEDLSAQNRTLEASNRRLEAMVKLLGQTIDDRDKMIVSLHQPDPEAGHCLVCRMPVVQRVTWVHE